MLLTFLTLQALAGIAPAPPGGAGLPPAAALLQDEERFKTSREGALPLALPDEEDAFCFAVFGDRTGGPPEGVKVLAQAVEEVNLLEPDLVMTVGDLIQGYNTEKPWMEEMREYKGIMSRLKMPWFPVPGNHDIYWRGEGKPTYEHERNYEAHFGPLWYAFEHKDCWFLALFSDERNPVNGARDFGRPDCHVMSKEQFAWLDATLRETVGARHVFVFIHHPRWLGGRYGSDWERIHARLAEAGNVRAVFAGHIHRMRYDGERDGIEYFTLATVGGGQAGDIPQAGWLHHYNYVTVRDEGVAIVSYPVGSAQDPRAIEGDVADEVRSLANRFQPSFLHRPAMGANFSVDGVTTVRFKNPSSRSVDLTLGVESEDSRWLFLPDHAHLVVAPDEEVNLEFRILRGKGGLDEALRLPMLHVAADYLGEDLRVELPRRDYAIPLELEQVPSPPLPTSETALKLDGTRDALVVPSSELELPEGPFTLEGWMNADSFSERQGLFCKTENSDYGIFVGGGMPAFYVHVGGEYATAEATELRLETGRWYHVAGVYDGEEARLYVDGKLAASASARGTLRTNGLPLVLGADVDGRGLPTSHFHGRIDEVRLSKTARYTGDGSVLEWRLERDDDTLLLLHFDGPFGPWSYDDSGRANHARVLGNPAHAPVR